MVPTFNRRELVCRALDSALAQSYPHQEIIVVDDGSTDGTDVVLRDRYGARIRYLRQQNRGVSSARNLGMRQASGELIALLDSDDWWDATKLAKQVAWLAARPDFSMVMTDVQRVDGALQPINVLRRRDTIRRDGDVLDQVVLMPSLVPASILMRREVFERTGGFDETLRTAEDIEFHLRIAAQFKIGVIDEPLTVARRGDDGLSEVASSYGDYVHVMERFIEAHRARLPAATRRAALFAAYERNARGALFSGHFSEGGSYCLRAMRLTRSTRELVSMLRTASLGLRLRLARTLRGAAARRSA